MSIARRADVPPGLLLVDKPGGMTSHDVVARARRVLSVRKVGHAGTLDPMATGLLILGVGAATRLLGYVGGHDKTYEATIRLGAVDGHRRPRGRGARDRLRPRTWTTTPIRAALAAQTGPLQQVPSSVSAVKVDGRRSYDRVRAGEAVELAPRSVTVHRLEVHRIARPRRPGRRRRHRACTAGTYIRAIARDAGAALGVGGHLTALRRTVSGPFASPQAAPVEEAAAALLAGGRHRASSGSTEAAATVFPARAVTADEARALVLRPADPGHRRARPARRRGPGRPAGRPRRGRRHDRAGGRRLPAG